MEKKPIIFLVYKLFGVLGFIVCLIGVIKLVNGFGNFEDNSFITGTLMMSLGFFFSVMGLVMGFRPEITKHSIKTAKYIQEHNKEELKEMMNTSAEIHLQAVTTTVEAVKAGMSDTIFCKHCGQKIEADSQFCKYCGEKL